QPLDRTAECELRAAEPFHEVAAPSGADRLQGAKLAVYRAIAARNTLGTNGVARHDSVALEQELGERAPVGLAAGEEPRRERPPSLRRSRAMGTGAGEAAGAAIGPRRPVATLRAKWRP